MTFLLLASSNLSKDGYFNPKTANLDTIQSFQLYGDLEYSTNFSLSKLLNTAHYNPSADKCFLANPIKIFQANNKSCYGLRKVFSIVF